MGCSIYALARDCEMVVIDGDRRFGNGWLLPAGPLRETGRGWPAATPSWSTAGARCSTARSHAARGQERDGALRGGGARPLRDVRRHRRVHAVAGIGNPERFFNMLRATASRSCRIRCADHAPLGAADIEFADGKPVLMTEKDAVKCARAGRRSALVRAGDRKLRGRRIDCAARHRDRANCANAAAARIVTWISDCSNCWSVRSARDRCAMARSGQSLELVCRADRLAYARARRHPGDDAGRGAPPRTRTIRLSGAAERAPGNAACFTSSFRPRFAASRLPGKPLSPIAGRPLIQWVWECARASGAASVLVATDDERIRAAARGLRRGCAR